MGRKKATAPKDMKCHTVTLSKSNKVYAKSDKAPIHRVKQDLRKLHGRPDVSKIYVGKTSAPTRSVSAANKAMKTRFDETKDKMGITDIKLQYITKSKPYINNAEKKLIEYNDKQSKKAANQRGGGGGAPTDQPYKILYIAFKRKGKCQKR